MKHLMPTKSWARCLLTATVLSLATTQAIAIVPVTPEPVLVRDVDRRTNEPVHNTCVTSSAVSFVGKNGYTCSLFTVPAGKRLVVETVGYTLNGTLKAPLKMALFRALPAPVGSPTGPGPGTGTTSFPLETDLNTYTFYSLPSLGSFLIYSNTHATRFYLNENEILVAGAQFLGPLMTSPAEQVFIFSGYLVDK